MARGKVYTGNSSQGRSELFTREYIGMLSQGKGRKAYYILPTGELLRSLRKRVINETKGAFDIGIMTFDDIVSRVLSKSSVNIIERPIQLNIVKMVMRRLAENNELQVFRKMVAYDGFAGCVLEVITESKRALISPEEFADKVGQDAYLKEVSSIYRDYEDFLKLNSLLDREGTYMEALGLLNDKSLELDGLERVYIDQFYDFRPIEFEILKELYRWDIDLHINMPFGEREGTTILSKTISRLEGLGFDIIEDTFEDEGVFTRFSQALINQSTSVDPQGAISVIQADSPELEVKLCINKIKRLIIAGANPSTIQVVATSSWYRELFLELALEENLNVNVPIKKELSESRLVGGFVETLRLRETNADKEAIINFIKSPIINRDEIDDELELGIRKLNFSNLHELREILESSSKLNINQVNLGKVHDLVKRLQELMEYREDKSTLVGYCSYALEILDYLKLQDYVMEKSQVIGGWKWLVNEMNALWSLREILDRIMKMDYISWDLEFTDFSEILRDYIQQSEIIVGNPSTNGIDLVNPTNGRSISKEYKFILGMNKSQYPLLDEDNFLFSEKRLGILRSFGVTRLDHQERFENELLKLSNILGTVKGHLYLGTSSSLGGEDDIPSVFLSRILRSAGHDEENSKVDIQTMDREGYMNSDLESISNKSDFENMALLRYFHGILPSGSLQYLVTKEPELIEAINRRLVPEVGRSSGLPCKYSGVLSQPKTLESIGRDIKDKVFSVSYIEEYLKCPYAFLLGKYFRIVETPRRWIETKPIDRGQIYHKVLYSYYTNYKWDMENSLNEFNVDSTRDFLWSLITQEANAFGIDYVTGGGRLFLRSLEDTLFNYIKTDVDRMKGSSKKTSPHRLEMEFGRDGSFYLEKDSRHVHFRGVIDRIDRVDNDNLIVIDYKSSPYGKRSRSDMEKGLSIQLPVYIMSQGEGAVSGGYYGILSTGDLYPAIAINGKAPYVTGRNTGAVAEEEFQAILQTSREIVFKAIDDIQEGNFSVTPKECSEYCIFKDICRYGRKWEVD